VTAPLSEIEAMLQSMAEDIEGAIGKAVSTAQSAAVLAGATGSNRMYINMNEETAQVFREGANLMATKARAYAGGVSEQVAAAVDLKLTQLIDRVIDGRRETASQSRTATDRTVWVEKLQSELARLKDDAVNPRPRSLP
jgi:hypothetical protein